MKIIFGLKSYLRQDDIFPIIKKEDRKKYILETKKTSVFALYQYSLAYKNLFNKVLKKFFK